jgi:hypothetical protein
MTVPFDPIYHLGNVYEQIFTRLVRVEFSDILPDIPDTPFEPDINIPRHSLYVACRPRNNEPASVSVMRMFVFFFLLKGAEELRPPIYSIPTDRYQEEVKFAPQVTLFFEENLSDVEDGYTAIKAQISFRIISESPTTMTEAKARTLATAIKREMMDGAIPFKFKKGRVKVNYLDKERGYWFILSVFNKQEGKEVIQQILKINNDSPDWDKVTFSELENAPPIVPPQAVIYGESRRLPRKRPIGTVHFRKAEMHLHGLAHAIVLYDATGRSRRALVNI